MMFSLYDYQQDAVVQLRTAYQSGAKAPLLVMPTGAGKTMTFAFMASEAAKKGLKVLLLAHRRELVGQISEALTRWLVAHGLVSPAHPATNHAVQVAMVQTLVKRIKLDKVGRFKFDLVIIDEAHHATRDSTWGTVLAHNDRAKFLGVTATPCRLDGKGLGQHAQGFFDAMVIGPSVIELIALGKLTRPVIYGSEQVAVSGVKKRGGDYVTSDLAKAMDKASLTGDAVEHYRKLCAGVPAIAFAVTVEHAAHVVNDFKVAGFQAAVLTGATPDKERAQMIKDLGSGHLQVLASCNVVSEGTDIPAVGAAILLRPTLSYALAMQQMGRALRAFAGKDKAIILDHAGNCLRHGSPVDEVHWSLDGMRDTGGNNPKVKRCFGCKVLVSVSLNQCPECGHCFKVTLSDQFESSLDLPEHSDAQLVELSPAKLQELRRQKFKQEKQAGSVGELARIGKERGYKYPQQWAAKRFVELHP